MFSIYTQKKKESPILRDLRSPIQRCERRERSCKLKHIVIFTQFGAWPTSSASTTKHSQEPITRSLHLPYILESTSARLFLFLEQSSPQASSNSRESILFSLTSAYNFEKNGGRSGKSRLVSYSHIPVKVSVQKPVFTADRPWFLTYCLLINNLIRLTSSSRIQNYPSR